jgi:hypothetical protein
MRLPPLDEVQQKCKGLYSWAKNILQQADPDVRKEWESLADCVYSHIHENDECPAEAHMLQIAVALQVLECTAGHMAEGPEIMGMISGPMAALVARGYAEVRKERIEEEVSWPTNLAC